MKLVQALLVVILFCYYGVSFSQVPTLDPSQTVNPATGEMGFSLPLGVVRGVNGHNFPININYQAGIRYDQAASPVGLGFSYGPGGIVRRTVGVNDANTSASRREETGPFDHVTTGIHGTWEDISRVVTLTAAWLSLGTFTFTVGGVISAFSSIATILSGINISSVDFSSGGTHVSTYQYDVGKGVGYLNGGNNTDFPDIYLVSTPYVNGEIVLKNSDGDFVFQQNNASSEAVKVKYVNGKFLITLADGMQLFFDVTREQSSSTDVYYRRTDHTGLSFGSKFENQAKIPIQWYLTKVLFPGYVDGDGDKDPCTNPELDNGEWICYKYLKETKLGKTQLPYTVQTSPFTVTEMRAVELYIHPIFKRLAYREGVLCDVNLDSIITPNEYAKYNYSDSRMDDYWFNALDFDWLDREGKIPEAEVMECQSCNEDGASAPEKRKVLESVTVYSHQKTIIKQISFNTSYTLAPMSFTSFLKGSDGSFKYYGKAARLTLDKVVLSAPNVDDQHINFHYGNNPNATFDLRTITPIADGFGAFQENKDCWGYYCPPVNTTSNDFNAAGNAARAAKADAWSLSSISFTSGMSIKWDYEPQRYDAINGVKVTSGGGAPKYGGGIRVKKVTTNDGLGNKYETSYFYTDKQGVFEEKTDAVNQSCNSSGHATVEPYNYISEADYRDNLQTRGGLYTPAKVAYEMVQVVKNVKTNKDGTISAPNGYTVTEFTSPKEFPNLGAYGEIDCSWKRGLLNKYAVYNSKKILQTATNYIHNFYPGYVFWVNPVIDVGSQAILNGAIQTGIVQLVKQEKTIDGVASSKQYNYSHGTNEDNELDKSILTNEVYQIDIGPEVLDQDKPKCSNWVTDKEFVEHIEDQFSIQNLPSNSVVNLAVVTLNLRRGMHYNQTADDCGVYRKEFLFNVYIAKNVPVRNAEKLECEWSKPFEIKIEQPSPFGLACGTDCLKLKSIAFVCADDDVLVNDLVINYTKADYGLHVNNFHIILKNIEINAGNQIVSTIAEDVDEYPIGAITKASDLQLKYGTLKAGVYTNDDKDAVYLGIVNNKIITVNHAFLKTYTDYDGQPNQIIETNSDGKNRVTIPKPAYYEEIKFSGMKNKNMLTQACQSVVYDIDASTPTPIDPTSQTMRVVGSQATSWKDFGNGQWLPEASYVWKSPMQNGLPTIAFTDYNFTNPLLNTNWVLKDSLCKVNSSAQPVETAVPIGGTKRLYNSVVYGTNAKLPVASATNVKSDGFAVYTCDYDMNDATQPFYFDYNNGWGKGKNETGESKVTSEVQHFGSNTVYVKNTFGPSRNVRLEKDKDYILSAWVKPKGATAVTWNNVMALDYRHAPNPDARPPISYLDEEPHRATPCLTKEFTAKQYGDWYFVTTVLHPSKDLTDWSTPWFASLWVGAMSGEVYIDDIRFYPSNAFVSSTYYDEVLGLPILSVNANDNPSHKITYDGFGRVTKEEKIDKTKSFGDVGYATKLMEKEYFFMRSAAYQVYANKFENSSDQSFTPISDDVTSSRVSGGFGSGNCEQLTMGLHGVADLIIPAEFLSGEKVRISYSIKGAIETYMHILLITNKGEEQPEYIIGSGNWGSYSTTYDLTNKQNITEARIRIINYISEMAVFNVDDISVSILPF